MLFVRNVAIGSYFVSVKEEYNMVKPNEIEVYAQKMFAKYNC